MKLILTPAAGQTVDVGHGEFKRQFNRADQPFEVDDAHGRMLIGTGLFVEETAPAPQPETSRSKIVRKEAKE